MLNTDELILLIDDQQSVKDIYKLAKLIVYLGLKQLSADIIYSITWLISDKLFNLTHRLEPTPNGIDTIDSYSSNCPIPYFIRDTDIKSINDKELALSYLYRLYSLLLNLKLEFTDDDSIKVIDLLIFNLSEYVSYLGGNIQPPTPPTPSEFIDLDLWLWLASGGRANVTFEDNDYWLSRVPPEYEDLVSYFNIETLLYTTTSGTTGNYLKDEESNYSYSILGLYDYDKNLVYRSKDNLFIDRNRNTETPDTLNIANHTAITEPAKYWKLRVHDVPKPNSMEVYLYLSRNKNAQVFDLNDYYLSVIPETSFGLVDYFKTEHIFDSSYYYLKYEPERYDYEILGLYDIDKNLVYDNLDNLYITSGRGDIGIGSIQIANNDPISQEGMVFWKLRLIPKFTPVVISPVYGLMSPDDFDDIEYKLPDNSFTLDINMIPEIKEPGIMSEYDYLLHYNHGTNQPVSINNQYIKNITYGLYFDVLPYEDPIVYYNVTGPRYSSDIKYRLEEAVIEVNNTQYTVGSETIDFSWSNNWGYPEFTFKLSESSPYTEANLISYAIQATPAFNAILNLNPNDTTQGVNLDYRDLPSYLYIPGTDTKAKLKSGNTLEDVSISLVLEDGSDHRVNTNAMEQIKAGMIELSQDSEGYLQINLKHESGTIVWSVCTVLLKIIKKPEPEPFTLYYLNEPIGSDSSVGMHLGEGSYNTSPAISSSSDPYFAGKVIKLFDENDNDITTQYPNVFIEQMTFYSGTSSSTTKIARAGIQWDKEYDLVASISSNSGGFSFTSDYIGWESYSIEKPLIIAGNTGTGAVKFLKYESGMTAIAHCPWNREVAEYSYIRIKPDALGRACAYLDNSSPVDMISTTFILIKY